MVQWNALLIGFICIFFAAATLRFLLAQINVRHLRRFGHEAPPVFQGEIDASTLYRMRDYTAESSRFASIEQLFDDAITLIILLGGFLPWIAGVILSRNYHFVLSGLIFFGVLSLASGILSIPFSLYSTFVIEKKYGFSTITLRLWMADLIKGLLISTLLMGILLGALLGLIWFAERTWWLWAWLFFSAFQMLMVLLYPVLIAPVFNKFEPVQNEAFKDAIIAVMSKAGLETSGIYQIDAGKRSRHTNAYFTGLGKTKRIVLYDTLLASHTPDEIISVLAHEIGHWKKKHILKQLVFTEAASLFVFYLAYRFSDWPLLYATFGFTQAIPYVGLLLMAAILGPVAFFLSPAGSAITRKFEREADDFGFRLVGTSIPLANALKRLAKDNLANLHPHPFYAWFYYSHPPLTERISRLLEMEKQQNSPLKYQT